MISETDFRVAVGSRLRLLRAALGKTQKQLADKLDVGATAVANYENGDRAIDPFAAFKLKLSFGVPLEWLYGGDESTLPPNLAEKIDFARSAAEKLKTQNRGRGPRPIKPRKSA